MVNSSKGSPAPGPAANESPRAAQGYSGSARGNSSPTFSCGYATAELKGAVETVGVAEASETAEKRRKASLRPIMIIYLIFRSGKRWLLNKRVIDQASVISRD